MAKRRKRRRKQTLKTLVEDVHKGCCSFRGHRLVWGQEGLINQHKAMRAECTLCGQDVTVMYREHDGNVEILGLAGVTFCHEVRERQQYERGLVSGHDAWV